MYYERVRAERELSSPALWDRIAACQRALGRGEGSAGIYHDVINGACPALLANFEKHTTNLLRNRMLDRSHQAGFLMCSASCEQR